MNASFQYDSAVKMEYQILYIKRDDINDCTGYKSNRLSGVVPAMKKMKKAPDSCQVLLQLKSVST